MDFLDALTEMRKNPDVEFSDDAGHRNRLHSDGRLEYFDRGKGQWCDNPDSFNGLLLNNWRPIKTTE